MACKEGNAPGMHAELRDALEELSPARQAAARAQLLRPAAGYAPVSEDGATSTRFHCKRHDATIQFGADGAVTWLMVGGNTIVGGGGAGHLGLVRYQTLSEDNMTQFDALYTGNCLSHNQSAIETVGCHNFVSRAFPSCTRSILAEIYLCHACSCQIEKLRMETPGQAKPNMSSAFGGDTSRGYGVHSPHLRKLWRREDGGDAKASACAFVAESDFGEAIAAAGAPQSVVTTFVLTEHGIEINATAINKTATRLPEALWVSFRPTATEADGWRLRYFRKTEVAPADVVEHGAVHLHALGADGALVYAPHSPVAPMSLEIVSLDVPVVSAGLLSPFPTALNNGTKDNDTALIHGWVREAGWHYNVQNQIWNTNFPQYYPFDRQDTEILTRFSVSLRP
eukprot:SAG25_NODE_331_length_9668_cov_3.863518_8_plen_396_part_00